MRRRVVVIGGTIASVYACSLIYRSLAPRLPRVDFASRDADARYTPQSTDERLEVFERIAEKYDRATRFHEWMWGIKAQRKTILQHARGKVLEVGVGTGRNFALYPASSVVSSIDAVDTSEKMLEQARSIVEQLKADPATSTSLPPITFLTASVENLPYPSGSFDTVVDTFGLASYADPAAALREIHRVTRQDGRGRILLLETGRSSEYAWLNKYLETRRVKRLREAASDPTVDVDALVKTLDGKVKVVERRVSMFGTMHAYVLAVPAKRKPDAAAVK